MPSWCQNELTVTGPEPELDRFLEAAAGTPISPLLEAMPLCLDRLYPIPACVDKYASVCDNAGANRCAWCMAHWGTEWDVGEAWGCEREGPERLFLGFETAWTPPLAAFSERIAPDFPRLAFRLRFEDGRGAFAGEREWQGGKLVRSEEREPFPEDAGGQR